LLVLLLAQSAAAGLAPLRVKGRRAALATAAGLSAERDALRYRMRLGRVDAEQTLVLAAGERGGRFWLGLPLPADPAAAAQALRVVRVEGDRERPLASRRRRAAAGGPPGVAAWQTVRLRLAAGQRVELRARWWQPHAEVEVYGYWRFALRDPLWTAGAFAGPVAAIERRVELRDGVRWMSSQPAAETVGTAERDWESRDRLLALQDADPEPGKRWLVKVKRSRAAASPCSGADPWTALDGDPKTVWRPEPCPPEQAWIELAADCRGFGGAAPKCERVLGSSWILGLSVRTPQGRGRAPVEISGFRGPKRIWRERGRLNAPIPVQRRDRSTRYRVRLPRGIPEAGAEITLVRLDPDKSKKGFARVLTGRGFLKMGKRCVFHFELVNPAPLRHATLRLNPRSKVDTYLLNMDCSDGRSREPFHEPVQCNHTPEQHRRLGLDPNLVHSGHAEGHYRRKHPNQIELPLDPSCAAQRLRLVAPPTLCTKRFSAPVPKVELVY
jgi:hypothetical protein